MPKDYYIKIPTRKFDGTWNYTVFPTKEDLKVYVKSLFKEPGKYQFEVSISEKFNEQARTFNKKKLFCEAPEGSRDYQEYWDTEKEKCRKGVIFIGETGNQWYLPRFYYHWINFLQIYDKREDVKDFVFPDVRDVQYHMALYEHLAHLHSKNSAILKSRQKASSYFHIAEIYNRYIFETGYVGKIGASDKKYINKTKGSWKFLAQYHNFTNTNTAWACSNNPDKEFEWEQKIETKTEDGRKIHVGTMATITGVSFDQDPVSGVGGATDFFFYEEGGIAPTADTTYGYIMEAMREGAEVTGMFAIAGSVGALDQCEPLKKFVLHPIENGFYPVWSNLLDEYGTEGWTALFIPEQWGMIPFIDAAGNSMTIEAKKWLDEEYESIKNTEGYQLRLSQRPRNIQEALAIRTQSIFPVKHTTNQIKRIENNTYYARNVDLERTQENTIIYKNSERTPNKYPVSKTQEDKRGCVVIHVPPPKNPEWDMFYWVADPVEVGKTDTSESVATIYIWQNGVEVTEIDANGESKTYIEGGKLAAEWAGRYDDPNETNEYICMLIELYNAWGTSENNKTTLINYMIAKKLTKHLATVNEMLFDKEIEVKQNVYQRYGFTRTTALWAKFLENAVNFLSEVLGDEKDDKGVIKWVKYGVEKIGPFIWLLKEMQNYQDKKNFDRLSSFAPLITFVKIQEAQKGLKKKVIQAEQDNKKKSPIFVSGLMMKSVGRKNAGMMRMKGNPFKSLH